MKKDRDSFFAGYGYASMPQGMQPHQQMMPAPNHHAAPQQHPMASEIDARLSKIERKINRLEMRVNKLEGESTNTHVPYNDNEFNYSSSMYMV